MAAGAGAETMAMAAEEAAGCTARAFSAARAARPSSFTAEGMSSNRAAGAETRALRRDMRKEHGAEARGRGKAQRARLYTRLFVRGENRKKVVF